MKEAPTSWNALWDKQVCRQSDDPGMPDIQGTSLTDHRNKMARRRRLQEERRGRHQEAGRNRAECTDLGSEARRLHADRQRAGGARHRLERARAGLRRHLRRQARRRLPQEGSGFQINTINLVKNAPQSAAAKTSSTMRSKPEAQTAFTEEMFYAPTNSKGEDLGGRDRPHGGGAMDKMIAIDWIAVAGFATRSWSNGAVASSRSAARPFLRVPAATLSRRNAIQKDLRSPGAAGSTR